MYVEILHSLPHLVSFHVLVSDFIIYTFFTHITASSTATENVTNSVTHAQNIEYTNV